MCIVLLLLFVVKVILVCWWLVFCYLCLCIIRGKFIGLIVIFFIVFLWLWKMVWIMVGNGFNLVGEGSLGRSELGLMLSLFFCIWGVR